MIAKFIDRIRTYFLRRRQDPDRPLSRQERRHLEQRIEKQARKARLA